MTSPLVSCTELAASLAGPRPPVLLDVRWRLGGPPGREDYDRGHLPGAVYLDLDADLAGPPGAGGRHPLPDVEGLRRALRAAGVREDRPVVVYDADNGSIAARAWWLLRWAGHPSVRVLDGGFTAWSAERRPVTTAVPSPEPGDFTVRPGGMPVLDADEAGELARHGVLIDARAPERYRGEVEPIDPRAGHIPGAVNAPFAGHVDDNGRWRTPEQLADRFIDIGVGAGAPDIGAGNGVGTGVGTGAEAEAGAGTGAGAGAGTGAGTGTGAGAGAGTEAGTGAEGGTGAGTEGGTEAGVGVGAEVGAEGEGGFGVGGGGADRVADKPPVGAYCGSGVTAASVVLALEVAGITSPHAPAHLYVGSWSQWSSDPDRPVATGPEPG